MIEERMHCKIIIFSFLIIFAYICTKDEEPVIELPLEVLERLIKRPEDLPKQTEENLGKYKTNMLRILEVYRQII